MGFSVILLLSCELVQSSPVGWGANSVVASEWHVKSPAGWCFDGARRYGALSTSERDVRRVRAR